MLTNNISKQGKKLNCNDSFFKYILSKLHMNP